MARRGSKRKRGQKRVLGEIQKQLLIQAERWGNGGFYTPIKLEEMVLAQCYKVKSEFLIERSNLEYELQRIGSNKKDCLIKLERLETYLTKAKRAIDGHQKGISKILDKMVGDREKIIKALGKTFRKPAVSLLIGDN
jgi:hypothetical protein